MSSLKEGLEKSRVNPNREPCDKDEHAVGESNEARDNGTRGVAAEGFSVDLTATQIDGVPRRLGANFGSYGTDSQRRGPMRLGKGLDDRVTTQEWGSRLCAKAQKMSTLLVQQTLVV